MAKWLTRSPAERQCGGSNPSPCFFLRKIKKIWGWIFLSKNRMDCKKTFQTQAILEFARGTLLDKMSNKSFTITKKIAKHGNQAIIVIPKILENRLIPGTITKVIIEILEEKAEGGSE